LSFGLLCGLFFFLGFVLLSLVSGWLVSSIKIITRHGIILILIFQVVRIIALIDVVHILNPAVFQGLALQNL